MTAATKSDLSKRGGSMRIILLLSALFLAASNSAAVTLDLDNPNGIAALYSVGGGPAEDQTFVACTNGTGYFLEIQEDTPWTPFVVSPVPLADVVEWTPWMLYTRDGRWFARHDVRVVWEEMGIEMATTPPPCFEPVEAQQQSFGNVKQMFK